MSEHKMPACTRGRTHIGKFVDDLIEDVEGLEANGIDFVELGCSAVGEVDSGKSGLCGARNPPHDRKPLFGTQNLEMNDWYRYKYRLLIACSLVRYTGAS